MDAIAKAIPAKNKIWVVDIPCILFIVPSMSQDMENHSSILTEADDPEATTTSDDCDVPESTATLPDDCDVPESTTIPDPITESVDCDAPESTTIPDSEIVSVDCDTPVDTHIGVISNAAACSLQRIASTCFPFSTHILSFVVSRSCGPYTAAIVKPVPDVCSFVQRTNDPSNLSVSQKARSS